MVARATAAPPRGDGPIANSATAAPPRGDGRRPARATAAQRRELRGIGWFLFLTCALSWLAAGIVASSDLAVSAASRPGLLSASLIYGLVFGWQPLVALIVVRARIDPDHTDDHGLRAAPAGFVLVSTLAPIAVLVAAAGLERLVMRGSDPIHAGATAVSAGAAFGAVVALLQILAILWIQALSEELGWRSYLLGRAMRRLGAWPGLVMHGALWGLWYAPAFVVLGGGSSAQIFRFVVTCALLGALLGWLRLASRSVYVSAVSNAILTIGAGLPVMLEGETSARHAIYQPAGWIPLALGLLAILLVTSLRTAVVRPERELPPHLN